jgi:hypothetical protein
MHLPHMLGILRPIEAQIAPQHLFTLMTGNPHNELHRCSGQVFQRGKSPTGVMGLDILGNASELGDPLQVAPENLLFGNGRQFSSMVHEDPNGRFALGFSNTDTQKNRF